MNYKRTVCLSFLVIVSLVAGCSVSNRTETGNNIPISTVPGEVETTNTPPFTSTVGPTETQFSALRTELTVTPYIQKSIDQSMIPQCSGGGDIVPKPVGFGLSGAMILMDWNKNGFSLIGGNPLEQSEFISTGEDYPQLFGFSTNGEWLGYAINTPDKDNSITIYLLSASGETITNELDLSSYLSEIPPENKFLGLSGFSYWINNKLVYISLYSTINDGKPGLVTYLPKIVDPFTTVFMESLLGQLPDRHFISPFGVSPDEEKVLYASRDGLTLWDYKQKKILWSTKEIPSRNSRILWNRNNAFVVSIPFYGMSSDEETILISLLTNSVFSIFNSDYPAPQSTIFSAGWSPDGRYLALLAHSAAEENETIFVFDSIENQYVFQCPVQDPNDLTPSIVWTDQRQIIYSSGQLSPEIIDLDTGIIFELGIQGTVVGWSKFYPLQTLKRK